MNLGDPAHLEGPCHGTPHISVLWKNKFWNSRFGTRTYTWFSFPIKKESCSVVIKEKDDYFIVPKIQKTSKFFVTTAHTEQDFYFNGKDHNNKTWY